MLNSQERILVLVTPFPESKSKEQIKANMTYCKLNDIFLSTEQFTTAQGLCEYIKNFRVELVPKIRSACAGLKSKATIYNTTEKRTNNLFYGIEKKKVRILLYPGNRKDISNLKVNEATHNMIIQFDDSVTNFRATEPHECFPNFYQMCNSEIVAIKYIEALLIDACLCHYVGVSDAALHQDDKQKISKEKVSFLKELTDRNGLQTLSTSAQKLVKYVCSNLPDNTPYISFLSIFTIATLDSDYSKSDDALIETFFHDFFQLWKLFQKWYYQKHHLLFSEEKDIVDPIESIFNRNKYHGQISPDTAIKEIKDQLKSFKTERINETSKEARLYAFVILKKMPNSRKQKEICDSLFAGQLHQSKWRIKKWNDLNIFRDVYGLIEIVPFMLEA